MVLNSSRSSEESYLLHLLDECERGRPQVVCVSGAVAIGKTELLTAFCQQAADSGALVLSAVARPGDRDRPLGSFAQLLDRPGIPEEIREHLSASVSVIAAQPTYGTCTHPRSLLQDAALLADQVAALLSDLAGLGSVVLSIDDLQHMDCMSLQVLMQLLRRLTSGQVMIVFTEDAMVVPTHPVLRAEIGRHAGYSGIDLRPLEIEDIAGILGEYYEPELIDDLARYYQAQTGGAPLLVRALLDDHVAPESAGTVPDIDEPAAGPSFRGAVLAICMRWDDKTTAVAQAAAVLGDRADAHQVAKVLPCDLEHAQERLAALEATGLVGSGLLLRSARPVVLWNTPDQVRFDLRLRASRVLSAQGGVDQADRHAVPEPWSIDAFTEAARQAEEDYDSDQAAGLLDLAVAKAEEPAQKTALTVDLVRLQWRSDPSRAAAHLDDLLQSVDAGRLDGTDAVCLVRWLTWCGRFADADRVAGAVVTADSLGEQGTADLAALILVHGASLPSAAEWFSCLRADLDLLVQPPVDTKLLLGSGAQPGRFGLIAVAAFDHTQRVGADDLVIGHAEQVLANLPIDDETFEPIVLALRTLVLADRLRTAAQWTHVFLSEARARLAGYWQAVLTGLRAEIFLRSGDLVAALEWADRAFDLLSDAGWGVAIGQPISVGIRASAVTGGSAQAQWLRRPVPPQMDGTGYAIDYLAARAESELALGWVDEAAEDADHAAELAAGRFDLPTAVAVRSVQSAVAIERGEPERALELLGEQLRMPGSGGARVRGISLRLFAAALNGPTRADVLTESAGLLAHCGARYEQALTLAALGEIRSEEGAAEAASLVVRQALELAEKCGATVLYRRLRVLADELDLQIIDAAADLGPQPSPGIEQESSPPLHRAQHAARHREPPAPVHRGSLIESGNPSS
ncbi:tetratricopeptide (TPR) repeat protein [Nakamurella sp. UYEF19]|uniref:ATP-binding protein n=1 Tax=Nakamurella sp. UYEF19 TaxID=1756392 RepID=UPI00339203A5